MSSIVVLASCLMLTTAQLQIPAHRIASLPNFHHMQIPSLHNSEVLMTQSAHSILNQDTRVPLSPGILGSVPVLVSDAAQSILDQESRIVGYNLFQQQPLIIPQQQQPGSTFHGQFLPASSPAMFSFTPNNAITVSSAGRPLPPQSISIPVLNNPVSIKSPLNTQKTSDSASYAGQTYKQPTNFQPIYYDIPPNHPVPPPASKLSFRTEDRPSTSVPTSPSNPISDEDVVFMRPPLPSETRQFFENNRNSNQDHRSESSYMVEPQHHEASSRPFPSVPVPSAQKEEKQERRKKPKNRQSKANSLSKHKPALNRREEQLGNNESKNRESDSTGEFSEDNFLATLLDAYNPQYNYNQPLPETVNSFNTGEQIRDVPRVHKHIFVHSAPETYSDAPRVKVIRPPSRDKQMQIIFVKSPTEAPAPETIVELPPNESPKTLVYILSKKPDDKDGKVKVIQSPQASKPLPPEIYFIRYGDRRQESNKGYPVPNLQSLNENFNNYNNEPTNSQPLPLAAQNAYNPELLSFLRQKRNKDYGVDVYAPLMSYSATGQINEISNEEASLRKTNLDAFF